MEHRESFLAAAGQSVELIGAVWLLAVAWRARRSQGSGSSPMTYTDIPKLHSRIAASGYAGGAITVAAGLAVAVVGS